MIDPVCRLISVEAYRSGHIQSLQASEGLHVDDQFAVMVQLDVPMYLYAARISLRGPHILFPAPDAVLQQAPGEAIRFPAGDAWICYEKIQEDEKLCLVVADRPLRVHGGGLGPRGGGQSDGSDDKTADKRDGFDLLIEIPVSR